MRLVLCLLMLSLSPLVLAETALTADYWGWQLAGAARSEGDNLDFERDLSVDARTSVPIRWAWAPERRSRWPAWELRYLDLDAQGRAERPAGSSFGDLVFGGSAPVRTDANLEAMEVAAHYSWRPGGWLLRPGLRLQRLRGLLIIAEEGGSEDRQRFDEHFPMLELGVLRSIGRIGLETVFAGISDGDSRALIGQLTVAVPLRGGLNLRLGWTERRYRVRDAAADYDLDARLGGFTAGVGMAF